MIQLYQFLWCFAPYFLRKYLRRRSRTTIAYLDHWDERFGKPYPNPVKDCVWIHAVSVGETKAAQPVIELLKQHFPDMPFLLTQMTPTGRIIAEKLYPFAQFRYLPYDKKSYVLQFLEEHRPEMALLMETEVWPNLLFELKKRHIPVFLINARLSEKSFFGYRKIKSLVTPALQCFNKIFTQSEKDLVYFQQLGAKQLEVTGHVKYDMPLKADQRQLAEIFQQKLSAIQKPIIVCASTRVKDELNEAFLLLDEWCKHPLSALLVIVPRHTEVFNTVYNYSVQLGLNTVKRSLAPDITDATQIVIGDSIGELMAYYLCADIAFVGGSLVDTGCHNIIEPISCQVPTLFGYSIFNFEQVCEEALHSGCALQVGTTQEWYQQTEALLADDVMRQTMQKNAKDFIAKHQGASQKIVSQILIDIDRSEHD